jgi:hypothetical protein
MKYFQQHISPYPHNHDLHSLQKSFILLAGTAS